MYVNMYLMLYKHDTSLAGDFNGVKCFPNLVEARRAMFKQFELDIHGLGISKILIDEAVFKITSTGLTEIKEHKMNISEETQCKAPIGESYEIYFECINEEDGSTNDHYSIIVADYEETFYCEIVKAECNEKIFKYLITTLSCETKQIQSIRNVKFI